MNPNLPGPGDGVPRGKERPTPEEMLERARSEETENRRGKLKIFFGACPGVGKTYAMLEAAHLRRREGVDVAIGWVETHGRAETERLAEGIDRVPPRPVEYRGLTLKEFDLEAALARRPGLLLVDELAHTNAPGSKHARRWQDVDEILNAGIEVYSTLNVQHLESLSDVVSEIAGAPVRETVPDSIFEKANEIELVDLPPDELLQRLHEGKVYIPEQARRAMEAFFRKGNLIALRELTLRKTAERVDEQMSRWKREHGITQPWPTRERILVAVGPSPSSRVLVRAGYRMATRLKAPWIALSVETPGFRRLSPADRNRVAAHMALAERLGAETVAVEAENLVEGVLSLARQRDVTRMVVGKPPRRTLGQLLHGSMVDRLVRASGPIDVVVTTGEEEAESGPVTREPAPRPRAREYLASVLVVAFCSLLCWVGRPLLNIADQTMIYLLGVLYIASSSKRGPTLVASVGSVLALDFFFVEPSFTLSISDTRYLVTFAVMLAAAILVSGLTLRVRRQAEEARQRERRTAVLYMMSRSLAARGGVAEIAEATARHIEILFEIEAALLMPTAEGRLELRGGTDSEVFRRERERGVAQWVLEQAKPAGHGTDTLPGAEGLYLPLPGRTGTPGVLALNVAKKAEPFSPAQRQLLEVFLNHAALALERALLTDAAERDQMEIERERLRNDLLSAVSHDLRTPLAAVAGAASGLLEAGPSMTEESRRELVLTIREEAERLTRVMNDLLEIARIESGEIRVRKEWHAMEEIIGAALGRLESKLAGRPVRVDLPSDVLLVPVDAVLIEQLLINLLENAAKYTPAGSPIELSARTEGTSVRIRVADRGPGIVPGEEERVFDAFHRAGRPSGVRVSSDSAGTGLGLAVCRAVAKAHGGRVWVENREGGGAEFHVLLPLEAAPSPPIEAEPSGGENDS